MEFAEVQNKQLQQLAHLDKLHKLQTKCESLEKDLENLITERSNSSKKRKMLMERLPLVQEELKEAKKKEYNWQIKLATANQILKDDNNDDLQNICLLLGFQISKFQLLENNGLQITLQYRNLCYVTYRESAQIFDLVEIFPQHNNFKQIKEFLQNSQDFRGLLSCLRKYFDLTLECKGKQEQK